MQIKEDEKGNDGIVCRQKKEENGIVLSHLLKSSPPVAESQTNSHVHIGFIVLLLMFSKPEFFFDEMLLLLFILQLMFSKPENKSPFICF